jgi:hypothetical protein
MAGNFPNEGRDVALKCIYQRITVDRDATLLLGLFNNNGGTALSTASALSSVAVVTGAGATAKVLTDASWTVSSQAASYAKLTFTGGVGGFSAPVYGYYVYTVAGGGTARLLYYEVDASGPYTVNENDTYDVTLNVTALTP